MTGPIHIGGVGRTGTSVMAETFHANPDIVYFSEPRFLCDPGGLMTYIEGTTPPEECRVMMKNHFIPIMRRYLRQYGYDDSVYTSEVINAILSELAPVNRVRCAAQVTERLFGLMGDNWVEKTPHTVRWVHYLYEMFGQRMRYIHMIRNPLDTVHSLMRQGWGGGDVWESSNYYSRILEDAWNSYREAGKPANYLVVSLDNLVDNPVTEIGRVVEFTGVSLTADLIDTKKSHRGRGGTFTQAEKDIILTRCEAWYQRWLEEAD